jgi:hypothetical protein
MTRRSKRELERALDDLAGDADADADADEYNVTADWVEYDDNGDDAEVVANYQVVMRRERAEREGVEILGPVDGPGDLVRIDWDERADQ